jgi:hypothetical protein
MGGHIERRLGALPRAVHKLPGATFSKRRSAAVTIPEAKADSGS